MDGNMMLKSVTKELDKAIEEVSARYPDMEVSVDFQPYKAVTCKYERGYYWMNMHLGDYLADAPAEVLAGLIVSCMDRVYGKNTDFDVLSLTKYAMPHRDVYLKRNRLEMCEHLTSKVRAYLKAEGATWSEQVIVATGPRANTSRLMKVITVTDGYDTGALLSAADELIGMVGPKGE